MTNSWDPVLLPPGYAYGFTGGPAHETRIIKMDGGGEQRVQVREEPIWRWQALRKNFRDADVRGLRNWVLARRGALFGFLFLDPSDYSTNADNDTSAPLSVDQVLGFGDGTRTRFKLRKQYPDPGGMSSRDFPRRVVALSGAATAAVARLLDINHGASLAPTFAVDGLTVNGTLVGLGTEVELATAPDIGAQVTWGGYFAVPARFGETTDQGLDVAITGFASDEAAFEVESIPFDDPVPLVPGGSPYGVVVRANQVTSVELSARAGFLHDIQANANINAFLDDLSNYPAGGPHLKVRNWGGSTITVIDSFGSTVGTVAAGANRDLFVQEDGAGNRQPVLI